MQVPSNIISCSGGHYLGAFYGGKGGREEVPEMTFALRLCSSQAIFLIKASKMCIYLEE